MPKKFAIGGPNERERCVSIVQRYRDELYIAAQSGRFSDAYKIEIATKVIDRLDRIMDEMRKGARPTIGPAPAVSYDEIMRAQKIISMIEEEQQNPFLENEQKGNTR